MTGSKQADPQRHASDDARARELLRAPPEDIALPDFAALEAELTREIAQEHGAHASLRALGTPHRYLLALLPLCLAAAMTLLVRPRLDLAVYPSARMALVLCVVGVLVLLSLVFALWSLAWRPIPDWARTLLVAGGPVALLGLYSLPAAHSAHPASMQAEGLGPLLARALPCLLSGSLVAAGAVLLLRVFDRGATRASLLFAACGGLYANFLLQLHCSVTSPAHMLLSHLGVALLALGWVLLFERVRGARSSR
jgi:hypothetical protein